jgi:hypothetical protein
LIPSTVIREIYKHKKEAYLDCFSVFNKSLREIERTPGHDIKTKFPKKETYLKNLYNRINNHLIEYDFVKKSEISHSRKAEALDNLIINCEEAPERLNDQMIIEEIRTYRYLSNYDRVILYTSNKKDFEDFIPEEIELFCSYDELISSLDSIFMIPETSEEASFIKFLKTDYAEELIENFCKEVIGADYKHNSYKYEHMVPEVAGEEAFYVVSFKGTNKQNNSIIEGELFFDRTNTITHIDFNYQ